MTMTQKILANRAGLDRVEAGQLILVELDRVLGSALPFLSKMWDSPSLNAQCCPSPHIFSTE